MCYCKYINQEGNLTEREIMNIQFTTLEDILEEERNSSKRWTPERVDREQTKLNKLKAEEAANPGAYGGMVQRQIERLEHQLACFSRGVI